jgi:hypothetical protein
VLMMVAGQVVRKLGWPETFVDGGADQNTVRHGTMRTAQTMAPPSVPSSTSHKKSHHSRQPWRLETTRETVADLSLL